MDRLSSKLRSSVLSEVDILRVELEFCDRFSFPARIRSPFLSRDMFASRDQVESAQETVARMSQTGRKYSDRCFDLRRTNEPSPILIL